MICWFLHRAHHVVLERMGDWSTFACAKCERAWVSSRLNEPRRFARQAKIGVSFPNPYYLDEAHATRDGYDPGEPDGDGGHVGGDPIGRGETRWAAIRDLLEQEAS